jgi:hypothetical protein
MKINHRQQIQLLDKLTNTTIRNIITFTICKHGDCVIKSLAIPYLPENSEIVKELIRLEGDHKVRTELYKKITKINDWMVSRLELEKKAIREKLIDFYMPEWMPFIFNGINDKISIQILDKCTEVDIQTEMAKHIDGSGQSTRILGKYNKYYDIRFEEQFNDDEPYSPEIIFND